ncbi:aldehyde dehydrogenase [Talaromyces proteolyticus]|uniref:Aldehyde dehydrogenase n=1 Tax=Talaromyces proteolyticus TaxID=1131652 RepID=A0AAD4KWF1_9EURO|nr:aldehyde dehydrogenase [Talaromyces proteolyticus]KAH8701581.1 aldehyde dehydrogenase [Talaromyces proteolyticus]
MALFQEIQAPNVKYNQPLGLFINNEFMKGIDGKTFVTTNPYDQKPIVAVHEATEKDVQVAVQAARGAFEGSWSIVTPSDRGKMLTKLADLMAAKLETIAATISLDNGKALSAAMFEVTNAIDCFRYYGGWADKVVGQTIDTDPASMTYTRHEPLGVCGLIVAWNLPISLLSWKVAPAIATGNTVVLKSAELTPLSSLYIAQLIKEAGFPAGVINILSGFGSIAGKAMTTHMDIDKISFTGSLAVGRQVLHAAANSNLKKVTLELGGKSPNIVFPDANLDHVMSWVNVGAFFYQGQVCCAGSRILVHEAIYERFLDMLKKRTKINKVGDPFDPDTFQGPQVSVAQFERVMAYIEDGKKAGATIIAGGGRIGSEGLFIQPTIFTDVRDDMAIVKDEIFGPVCTVHKFKDEKEAIEIANSTHYGLAAAVHTADLNTAFHVSNSIKAGTVWINNFGLINPQAPFGGYKQSGFGRELGSYALEAYTQVKLVRCWLAGPVFP